MKRRPKQSEIARSVDKLKPQISPEERRAQIGIALSVAIVVLIYISVIFFVKGCIHK